MAKTKLWQELDGPKMDFFLIGLIDSSCDLQTICVISFVIILNLVILIAFERGPQIFSRLNTP
jgi:hypothetical protein